MLKRFRIERGVEAQQICDGLCSTAMMSYFESGKKVPDSLMFEYLIERIGGSTENFSIMVSQEEYEYLEWREHACEAIRKADWDRLKELADLDVCKKTYCNQKLEYQFALYVRGLCLATDGAYAKAAELFEEAFAQTMPNIDEGAERKNLYSSMELHIYMLYLYYGVLGQSLEKKDALERFYSLERYVYSGELESCERAKCYSKLICIGLNIFATDISDVEQRLLCERAVTLLRKEMLFHDIVELLSLYTDLLSLDKGEKLSFYRKQLEVFTDILQSENVDVSFQPGAFIITKPKYYMLHEYLHTQRIANNTTQEQISDGICEPETYSRVENGRRAPSRKNFKALANRLGIQWCYYRGELDSCERKTYELRCEQRDAGIKKEYQKELELLYQMEEILDMESVVNYQYVKSNEYVAKYYLEQMTDEEVYDKLKELLYMTQKMEADDTRLVYYSQTELEIIGHMAQSLRRQQKYEEGIKLVELVIKQMRHSKLKIEDQWNGYSFLLRILSGLYFGIGKYKKSIEVMNYVKREIVNREDCANLALVFDGIADSLEHLGKQYSEEYEKLYCYTYYVADFCKIVSIKNFTKEYYEKLIVDSMVWY